MKKILLFVLLVTCEMMQSCNVENNNASVNNLPAARITDISYGPDQRNNMDAVLPAKRNSSTPVIILIHGGGWTSGDKTDMSALQDSLSNRGVASISINYRYASPSVHYEALMQDVQQAIAKIEANADNWHIRKDKFMIGGISAGAHMSLLYAYKYDTDHRISGVISAAGPTDFTDQAWLNYTAFINILSSINYLIGVDYNPFIPLDPKFSAASPIKNLANVPTLMIHGDADMVVYYSQSASLQAALNAKGYTNKLVTIPGANHDLSLGNTTTAVQIINEISLWINTYGK